MEKRTPGTGGGGPAGAGGQATGAGRTPGNILVPAMGEETPYQRQMQREIATLDGPVSCSRCRTTR